MRGIGGAAGARGVGTQDAVSYFRCPNLPEGAEAMAQRPTHTNTTPTVRAEQVEAPAVELLRQTWDFKWEVYRYTAADLYRVLLAAAVQQQSVSSICAHFTAGPSATWVWHVLQT